MFGPVMAYLDEMSGEIVDSHQKDRVGPAVAFNIATKDHPCLSMYYQERDRNQVVVRYTVFYFDCFIFIKAARQFGFISTNQVS